MKKVIGLKNTYCEADQESLKALIKKGYTWTDSTLEDYRTLIIESDNLELNAGTYSWENAEEYTEIKLIDGEFYYANSIGTIESNSKGLKIEFKRELLDGKVGVLIETFEQSEQFCQWICDNADKRLRRYTHVGSELHIGNIVYVGGGFGNCYEWSLIADFTKPIWSFKSAIHPTKLNDKDFKKHTDIVFGEECQFAKYGFEVPDFEANIYFKNINSSDKKEYYFGDIATADCAAYWSQDGECVSAYNTRNMPQFNLVPVKKPWHENESNFPCFCYTEDEDVPQTIQYILEKDNLGFVARHPLENECMRFKEVRRLSKEEVLSLYKEEK